MTSYAQIDRQATLFLTFTQPVLNGRIPRGEVTILAGEGGAGKGQMGIWMCVDQALQGHHVILVTPEDNLQATVRPRLEATLRALAPGHTPALAAEVLGRVHDMTFTRSGAPFELSADGRHEGSIGQLRELVDNPTLDSEAPDPGYDGAPCRLVVIDPLLACLAFGSIASNQGARRVFAPLTRLATETGCGLVLTHHTVASGKVAGSKGLTDAARLVYRAKRDRENPGIRVLEIEKSNILADDDPVRYTIHGDGADTYVRWLDREELMLRRTAWRAVPELVPEPVPDPRAAVLEWLDAGGGDAGECAEATGLDEDEATALLEELTADGVAGQRRRLAVPWRR
jgi:hypothetical protein